MKSSAAEILQEYGPFPGVNHVHGVTYDGQHLWFASGDRLNAMDPASGETVRAVDLPAHAGTAFDGQHLFQIAEAILRTIESNRLVTGVTWIDGELWHGTSEGDESELRRVDPQTGDVLESVEMSPGLAVSGLDSDGSGRFFCGGGSSGKIRAVRRPK
jgi:glutamine cyclotransferase